MRAVSFRSKAKTNDYRTFQLRFVHNFRSVFGYVTQQNAIVHECINAEQFTCRNVAILFL